jgi:hypothetical protein
LKLSSFTQRSTTVASAVVVAVTGLTLLASCAGDKVVEPGSGTAVSQAALQAGTWRAPNGNLVGLTHLSMEGPPMDSVNHCHTAVYFGNKASTDPYRYEKKILRSAAGSRSAPPTAEVKRVRNFRFSVALKRITRMADCVIEYTPEMIAVTKSLFRRRASGVSLYDAPGNPVGLTEEEELDYEEELVGEESGEEFLEPDYAPSGEAADSAFDPAAHDSFEDVIRDAVPQFYLGSVIPTKRTMAKASSPLFKSAVPARRMGDWSCYYTSQNSVGQSIIGTMSCEGDTSITCNWIPGGGFTQNWYVCSGGCYAVIGVYYNSGSGITCLEWGDTDPETGCEPGQVLSNDGICICYEGDMMISPLDRARMKGGAIGGEDGVMYEENQSELEEADSPSEDISAAAGPEFVNSAPLKASAARPGDEMPECGNEPEGFPDISATPPLSLSCDATTLGAAGRLSCRATASSEFSPLSSFNGFTVDTVTWHYEKFTQAGTLVQVGGSGSPITSAGMAYYPKVSGNLYVEVMGGGVTLWSNKIEITVDTTLPCDRFNPICWVRMSSEDSALLRAAMDTALVTRLASIADTFERRVCDTLFKLMKKKFNAGDTSYSNLFGDGGIFKGKAGVPDGSNHTGQAYGKSFHIDSDYLDSARTNPAANPPKSLLALMFHETGHTWFTDDLSANVLQEHDSTTVVHTTPPWKFFEETQSTATSGCVRI